MLHDEQVNRIKEDIEHSGITMQGLKDDLLDHFCCFIEDEMKRGLSFDAAYAKAQQQVCPDGLADIQQETIFLLSTKKITMMKKITYAIGALSAMTLCLGFLFKIQHYPGAVALHLYGMVGFFLIFLPLIFALQYKNFFSKVMSEKLRLVLGLGSSFVVAAGIIFKIQGNNFIGDILLLTGSLIFTFGFVPVLFFRMYKRSVQ